MKKLSFAGFKFNDEEAAKVNEAKKMQKWVGAWRFVNACLLRESRKAGSNSTFSAVPSRPYFSQFYLTPIVSVEFTPFTL